MRRALQLAARGRGRTSPNPLVGCVLVSPDGEVVGVVFGAAMDAEDTGYALTVDQVLPQLMAAVESWQPVATGSCVGAG